MVERDISDMVQDLKNYVDDSIDQIIRRPAGMLRHPFVGSGARYLDKLWDWDSYFTLLALTRLGFSASPVRGCVDNFLDHMGPDGSVPFRLAPDIPVAKLSSVRAPNSAMNSAKPVIGQIALLQNITADLGWLKSVAHKLAQHVAHWAETQQSHAGLFVWRSHRGCGADNHPALYGRPHDSVAGVELNCYFVREYEALATINRELGDNGRAARYERLAQELTCAINNVLWDPVDRTYYNNDVLGATPPGATEDVRWTVPLKFRTWTSFTPLWANVADTEHAAGVVESAVRDGGLFCSYGVRTLSSREPLYNVRASRNPSNWQGPVWIVANYIVFQGLVNYGYHGLARRIADSTVALLHDDLQRNGHWHEYYDPDEGHGIMTPGFLGWNILALIMHDVLQEAAGSMRSEFRRRIQTEATTT